jgi:subtilisin family serine protease
MSVVATGTTIPTTDIVGPTGYSGSTPIGGFEGISAAVPHLSGLATLIFGVFPGISPREVRLNIQ